MNVVNSTTTAQNTQAAGNKFRAFSLTQKIVTNDKISKKVFDLNNRAYQLGGINIVELETKDAGKILTTVKIKSDIYLASDAAPLSEFDRDVLTACISAYSQGSKIITLAQILRSLTGRPSNKNDARIYNNQLAAIQTSLQKLMNIVLDVDLSKVNKELNYSCADKIKSAILPACSVGIKINGQKVADVVLFTGESPLFTIAKSRKQILTYDAALLNVPSQGNSPLNIALKNCVVNRVIEIKKHRRSLKPILTFADIFRKCRVNIDSKKAKHDARATISKVFEHLQTVNEIKSFEIVKKQGAFYSVNFKL